MVLRASDWLLTLRQVGLDVFRLWPHLRPSVEVPSVAEINPRWLAEGGIEGIIWDVDGTLMERHGGAVAPHLRRAFAKLLSAPGVRHVILSNCDEGRFRQLGTIFPTVPILRAYRTSGGVLPRRLVGGEDTCREEEVGHHLARGARQIRKPNLTLIELAISELGDPDRQRVVLIGDQYLTDVASANLAGIRSIKVETVGRSSFPAAVRQLQRLDRWIGRLARGSAGARVPDAVKLDAR